MAVQNAAIVGAGMAGLTAALSLSQRGIRCQVIEQAPYLAEVGAGLQISPNAARVLARVGVLPEIEKIWCEPQRISLVSGQSLKTLAEVPVGRFARERWRAPYGVLHRSTLQNALERAVSAEPLCSLHLGHRLTVANASHIEALTGVRPDLIIGADGVWSQVRASVPGSPRPDFSSNVAWRFTIAENEAPAFLARDRVMAMLGASAHVVSYPLREMQGFNVVAIAAGVSPGETWDAQASQQNRHMLFAQFKNWHPQIIALLRQSESASFWPLYQVSDGRWQNDKDIVLVGDAAHAMMPFSAQGAAMAIEDAWELAQQVTRFSTLPEALGAYEQQRKARAQKVKARGSFNRFAYHATGPVRVARDIVLKLRSPSSLAADLDWLYGYDTGA
ncbi:FAD-dependent monooxygenase [Rhizobium oryzicola]|uniref:FAD-dependent monooxygenase n=1 Tax=Rhizobium oryzicola TaxID=1232668 RepID=A0ABT8T4N5_9HYPH|nr:FAD-dependent monooxygenase [Rhizobium oryzicola]MDO1585126.1 FAD-dependent monooxygenase [Rhizobium oryzicola]